VKGFSNFETRDFPGKRETANGKREKGAPYHN
jgi:hypothetical protein